MGCKGFTVDMSRQVGPYREPTITGKNVCITVEGGLYITIELNT